MSGIYINGMEMPKEGCRQIFITAEGVVFYFTSTPQEGLKTYEAISVPKHGALKDIDTIRDKFKYQLNNTYTDDYGLGFQNGLKTILSDYFPIIIPANKEV